MLRALACTAARGPVYVFLVHVGDDDTRSPRQGEMYLPHGGGGEEGGKRERRETREKERERGQEKGFRIRLLWF